MRWVLWDNTWTVQSYLIIRFNMSYMYTHTYMWTYSHVLKLYKPAVYSYLLTCSHNVWNCRYVQLYIRQYYYNRSEVQALLMAAVWFRPWISPPANVSAPLNYVKELRASWWKSWLIRSLWYSFNKLSDDFKQLQWNVKMLQWSFRAICELAEELTHSLHDGDVPLSPALHWLAVIR